MSYDPKPDETTHDETTPDQPPYSAVPNAAPPPPPVGFCQDCGRPLTAETVRRVGSGTFCEPCLALRAGVGAATAATVPGDSSPVLAGFLGIIPGVGAMYNGQYAKGFVHLAVSAVLFSVHNGNGVMGMLSFGWFCYQILDAYETAKARRDGLPLPNPLGLNDIGERMGFGRNWPSTPAWSSVPPSPPPHPAAAPAAQGPGAPIGAAPDWVGYVPPTAFGAPPPPYAATSYSTQPPYTAPYSAPYSATPPYPASGYPTAAPYAPIVAATTTPPVLVPARRFPAGAIWLIALGALFLLGERAPDWGWDYWGMMHRWLLPAILAVGGIWKLLQRWGTRSVHALRGPALLLTLAVLFGLQSADWASLRRTWPALLIVIGLLSLAERTGLRAPLAAPLPPTPTPSPSAQGPGAISNAAPNADKDGL